MNKQESQFFRYRVKALYGTTNQLCIAAIGVSTTVAFFLDRPEVWVWFGWWVFGASFFLGFSSKYKQEIDKTTDGKRLKMFLEHWQTQSIFLASMWAGLALLSVNFEPIDQMMLGFIFAGVTAGTSISSATFPNISRIYSAIILGTLICAYSIHSFADYGALCGVVILYTILVGTMQQKLFNFFKDNFDLIYQLEMTQKKLRDSQELLIKSSRLASQAEMMANLAHEINNPLAILFMHFHKAKQNINDNKMTLESTDKLIDRCLSLSERIRTTIVNTKKFLYHNMDAESPQVVEVQPIIAEMLYFFEPRCIENNVRFVAPPKIKLTAFCTEASLVQILSNLLNNALSATKEEENGWISLEVIQDGETVIFRVQNSGAAIEGENRKKIFESFFTKKEKGVGLGMGLPISRKLAERFGGSLELEENSPTSFVLRLRQNKPKSQSPFATKKVA